MKNTVSLLEGAALMTKRMEGTEGTAFPQHTASLESVLVMIEGSCTISFGDVSHELRPGDTFVVPADEVHQLVGTPDFRAIHVMPKDIRFTFRS